MGSSIQDISFVSECQADHEVILKFPHPIQCWAVVRASDRQDRPSTTPDGLLVLSVPTSSQESGTESDSDLLSVAQDWINAGPLAESSRCLVMTLQGARILWAPGRVAILAIPDRLVTIRNALVEVSYHEAELRRIERTLGEAWPQLEADMPIAFEFSERLIGRRKQLRNRFLQILSIRAKLARIGPFVHCPHLHPPTLASQIAERFRETSHTLVETVRFVWTKGLVSES